MSLMTRVPLLALVAATSSTFPPQDERFPPNNRVDSNRWSARLRNAIKNQADWDPLVPPTSNRSATVGPDGEHYSDSGTDVRIELRFFKVESVRPAAGSMSIKVWLRLWWVDERLAWDPASYGGITETFYNAETISNSEVTEIWVPDVQMYNGLEGLVHTSTTQSLEPGTSGMALTRVVRSSPRVGSGPGLRACIARRQRFLASPALGPAMPWHTHGAARRRLHDLALCCAALHCSCAGLALGRSQSCASSPALRVSHSTR
jgi:hypothetical protein